jgi:hypothetical protein
MLLQSTLFHEEHLPTNLSMSAIPCELHRESIASQRLDCTYGPEDDSRFEFAHVQLFRCKQGLTLNLTQHEKFDDRSSDND